MGNEREQLAMVVRAQADGSAAWERAACHLLAQELRERLSQLRLAPSEDLAVALMAAAMLLAERAPEWGGDARDALGELAQVGLALLGDEDGRN